MSRSYKPKILLVDDDSSVLEMLELLFEESYSTILASNGMKAVSCVREHSDIAAIVLDMKMAEMDGRQAARAIREIMPLTPIIFHTGYPGEFGEEQIDREDEPYDYVRKGRSVIQLQRSVRNAIETHQLRVGETQRSSSDGTFYGMVGNSLVMQQVYSTTNRVASTRGKVMILGETGTGKELVARAIHSISGGKERLGILNCNHKSPDLIESELFGHKKGSFTGAISDRVGLFEYANGGTVFLDEIGDLDQTTQAKLLRVLESGEYSVIGSPDTQKTDVRVLCATHRDLKQMVKSGEFREDLYYRLRGVVIEIPPLRSRREDIPLLVDYFREEVGQEHGSPPKVFDRSAMNTLIDYDWPGNVRELYELVKTVQILNESDIVFAADIEYHIGFKPNDERMEGTLSNQLREYERTLIIKALSDSDNNISKAARALRVDRANLSRKMRALRISVGPR